MTQPGATVSRSCDRCLHIPGSRARCPSFSLWNLCVFITSLMAKLHMAAEDAWVPILMLSNSKQFSPRHYFCDWQLLRLCCEQAGPLLGEVRGTNKPAVPFPLVRKVARSFEDAIISHVARATGTSCLFLACEQRTL